MDSYKSKTMSQQNQPTPNENRILIEQLREQVARLEGLLLKQKQPKSKKPKKPKSKRNRISAWSVFLKEQSALLTAADKPADALKGNWKTKQVSVKWKSFDPEAKAPYVAQASALNALREAEVPAKVPVAVAETKQDHAEDDEEQRRFEAELEKDLSDDCAAAGPPGVLLDHDSTTQLSILKVRLERNEMKASEMKKHLKEFGKDIAEIYKPVIEKYKHDKKKLRRHKKKALKKAIMDNYGWN